MTFGRDQVEAAARRLRGVLVETPLVGGLLLPGRDVGPGLRVKLECLQHGGSLWFRGAMHALGRQLGAPREAVAAGTFRAVLAGVFAARLQRVPVTAVLDAEPSDEERRLLVAAGTDAIELAAEGGAVGRAEELGRTRGAFVVPGPGDPAHDLGVATLGLELAAEMGADTDLVVVGPAALADAVGHGLRAGGRDLAVRAAPLPGDRQALETLRAVVRDGVRVDADHEGLAALAAAIDDPDATAACVVVGA